MALAASLVILAGGEGRRIGRPKALVPVAGMTLVEWVACRLTPTCRHLLVCARRPEQLPASLRAHFVADRYPDAGPLAGIAAGLAASPYDLVVVVACDMPRVTPTLVRRLARAAVGVEAAVPRIEGRPEPTCAAYRRSAGAAIEMALRHGHHRVAEVLSMLTVRWLEVEDPALFTNLNTPDDLLAFEEWLHAKGGSRPRSSAGGTLGRRRSDGFGYGPVPAETDGSP
jgi:molybdopterin-guanine dinucleotide biosynthesis protein A